LLPFDTCNEEIGDAAVTKTKSVRKLALLAFLIALATITGAWAFEIIGGYKPCALCLQQRWAYYFSLPILGLIWIRMATINSDIDVVRWGLIVVAIVMLANAGLGFYHSGVEWGWFEGPAACSSGAGLSGGLPDLSTAKVINCSDAQWRLLGLSFAGWNVVVSAMIAAIAALGARRA